MTISETNNNLPLPVGGVPSEARSSIPGDTSVALDVEAIDWFSATAANAHPISAEVSGLHGERTVEQMVDDILAHLLR